MHSPKVLTLAAAEHADQEGNNDNTTKHRQGDYQGLEVHCRQTQAISGRVIQETGHNRCLVRSGKLAGELQLVWRVTLLQV